MDTSHRPGLSARVVLVVSLSTADAHPPPHTLSCPGRVGPRRAEPEEGPWRAGPRRAGPKGRSLVCAGPEEGREGPGRAGLWGAGLVKKAGS